MEFDRDSKAGYKHHLSDRYRIYLKQKVMDMCTANELNQVDLLTPAERKISEKEYWAKRGRGQKKLDKHNAELEKKGLTPRRLLFKPRSNIFVMRLIQLLHGNITRRFFQIAV